MSGYDPQTFKSVRPWLVTDQNQCEFYHCLNFADGSSVVGPWDIRDKFEQYIGNYPITDKTVLDVGAASGFLSFSAEERGAQVVALESLSGAEYDQIHFLEKSYHYARPNHDVIMDNWLDTLKAGFWYSWRRKSSNVAVVYAPLVALPYWNRKFDVVIAGAILEHLADPVTTIWSLTNMAREAVIIAFTPVHLDDNMYMVPANNWDNPLHNYTWWTLSVGLYRRIFSNVGFNVEVVPVCASLNGIEVVRSTIVARRIVPVSS